jgi:hypothetical protein
VRASRSACARASSAARCSAAASRALTACEAASTCRVDVNALKANTRDRHLGCCHCNMMP